MRRKIYVYEIKYGDRSRLMLYAERVTGRPLPLPRGRARVSVEINPACVHEVEAPDTPTAKKLAVREHRAKCERQPAREKK